MMYSFSKFLTPEEYIAKCEKEPKIAHESLEVLKRRAKDNSRCFVCETQNVWRLAGQDLCFTCTTGEADASEDFEIGEPY